METLEAEVRSKFQTTKRMQESASGQPVEVSFDETVVKYHWLQERVFQVVEIELAAVSPTRLLEKEMLQLEPEDRSNLQDDLQGDADFGAV